MAQTHEPRRGDRTLAVARVKSGDSTFYEVLAEHLQRLAQKYLRNEADAEDAVQDAHLLAFTRIHQDAERSSFLKWISAITVNQALMRLRKSRASFVPLEGDFDLFASPVRDPEQQAISQNVGDRVEDALAPAIQRAPPSRRACPVRWAGPSSRPISCRCQEISSITRRK